MASNGTNAIAVNNVEMAYGEFVIQRDLEFNVRTGEVFVIMGDSGSGKSTLLRHLIGLQRPVKGSINYGDIDFWQLDDEQRRRSKFLRRKCGHPPISTIRFAPRRSIQA